MKKAIATSTHGSGIKFGSMSSYILKIELIDSFGNTIECNNDTNKDIFKAACNNLGCLGIITKVTIKCEERWNGQMKTVPISLDNILNNWRKYLLENDHLRLLWFPNTERCLFWTVSRTEKELYIPKKSFWKKFNEDFICHHILEFLYFVSKYFRFICPFINWMFSKYFLNYESHNISKSYQSLNFNVYFKQYVNEWAIPIE